MKSIFTLASTGTIEEFKSSFVPANLNDKDSNGSSLLHYALADEQFDVAEFLIEEGINVNLTNANLQTSLHLIALKKNKEMTQKLLEQNADLNAIDKFGNQPLWTAVFNARGDYRIVELFVSNGANSNNVNKAGRSPLDFAKQINDKVLIQILNN